jgi:hypothetical protein
MTLHAQLDNMPTVTLAELDNDDPIFVSKDGVNSRLPKSEIAGIADLSGVEADILALEALTTTHTTEIDALEDGVLFLTPQMFGAIADGATHPLSSVYANLPAAQAVYSFATSLTQEIDYCACKQMSNTALGADGAEHADANARLNRPMWITEGNYQFGNDTWLIRNASGIKMWGAAKRATRISGNNTILRFDGLWYSEIADLALLSLTNTAVVVLDIDGNVPGHPYATRGVQGNTFRNIFVDAGMSTQAVAMCRLGGSSGQGSENTFSNIHFNSADFAIYYQNGYNALNNTFSGGNFQGYNTNGFYLIAGQISIRDMGFQSTTGYTQVINDGWDINCSSGGVVDKIPISGCRTESVRFAKFAGSQVPHFDTCNGNPASYTWTALAAVALNTLIYKTIGGVPVWLRVTTAGVSAGAEPVWNATGTTNDGTAVWTAENIDWINIVRGSIDYETVETLAGRIINTTDAMHETATSYTVLPGIHDVFVDATAGPVTVTIPADNDQRYPIGYEIFITRLDASANVITVAQADSGNINFVVNSANIAGGARGFVRVKRMGGGLLTSRWMISGKGII